MSAAVKAMPEPAGPAVPRHIGIIMDGNGRWAAARGLPRALGHKAGADAARRTVEAAGQAGVGWLTLFAFSSENWRRPVEEVKDLTRLMRHYLATEVARLVKEGVRLRVIGERDRFGEDTARAIAAAEAATAGGTRLNLNLAVSYGGRGEIAAAAREIARRAAAGTLDPEAVDERNFGGFLSTAGMPHQRRAAHLQLPVVPGSLCRIRLPGRAVARLRRPAPRHRAGGVRPPRAPLRRPRRLTWPTA